MTFPTTARDAITELYIDGAWVNITTDVRLSERIKITRGKANEASQTAPSRCTLTLNNAQGKYSRSNPTSPYYGKFGRNTQMRVRLNDLPGPKFDASSSPTAGTGNLSWTHTPVGIPKGVLVWVVQTGATTDQVTSITYGGVTVWSGTNVDGFGETGGYIVSHFRGSDIPRGPQPVVVTVSGAATKQAVCITVTATSDVEIHDQEILNVGSPVANPSTFITPNTTKNTLILGALHSGRDAITDVAPGTGYTDVLEHDFGSDVMSVIRGTADAAAGTQPVVSWTAASDTRIIHEVALADTGVRFTGEIASLPTQWDPSGKDSWVPIQASGRLRRINQGNTPLTSSLKDTLVAASPYAYWPLDEGEDAGYGSQTGVSGPGGRFRKYPPDKQPDSPVIAFGTGDLGLYLPKGLGIAHTDTEGAGFLQGEIGMALIVTDWAVDFVYKASDLAPAKMHLTLWDGSLWTVELRADGVNDDIRLQHFTSGVGFDLTVDTGVLAAITDALLHHVRLRCTQNGADVDYAVYVDGTSVLSGTFSTLTLNGIHTVQWLYPVGGGGSSMALGHLAAWVNPIPSVSDIVLAMQAYAGETAGRRFERLCVAAGMTQFAWIGNLDATMKMGPQYTDHFETQLAEIEATDMGLIFELRDVFTLGYRTRESLYAQPAVTISYSGGQLAPPFEPVDDDQSTRNDVFAQRREGGSRQATLETGALSVQEPPNGVGRYKHEVTVNTQTDELLEGVAAWLLAAGTVDAPRFPELNFNLANSRVVAAGLERQLLSIIEGDRIVIQNASAVNLFDEVSVLVLGSEETIGPFEHRLSFNATPASPYAVSRYETGDNKRYDTTGSALDTAVTSSATSLVVKASATSGQTTLWTTTPAEFPLDVVVGGERITASAISSGTPTFVGAGTSATGNNSSVTPGLPAGVAAGDLVLIFASIRSEAATVNQPANWSDMMGLFSPLHMRIFGRIYDGAWSMPTVTVSGGAAGDDTIGQSAAFRGVSVSGAVQGTDSNASQQDIDMVVGTDSLDTMMENGGPALIVYAGWKQDDWTSVATPVSSTEIGEQVSTAGNDAGQVWGYQIPPAGQFDSSLVVTGGAAAIGRGFLLGLKGTQTFTVTRSVNGVVKSHSAGAAVRLFHTPRYAL